MARISARLSGIERSLLNSLADANAQATLSALRMATGHQITAPRDDPSAFLQLSGYQQRLAVVRAAAGNADAASSMVNQAQSTIAQIREQLDLIRDELLVDEDGTATQAERDEAQATIDDAIDEINRLAGTEIDGKRILDGSAAYVVTGRDPSQVARLTVYSALAGQSISGTVTVAATQASLTYTGDASNQVTDDAALTLTGPSGSYSFEVTAGDALSDVAEQINRYSHRTGVTAAVDEVAHELTCTTVEYGSDAEITVEVTSGTFDVSDGGQAAGTDAQATVNGETFVGEGNRFTYARNGLHVGFEIEPGYTGAIDEMTVTGGGLAFNLWTDPSRSATLAPPGLMAAQFSGLSGRLDQLADGGSLAGLGDNTSQAIRVVDEALDRLTRVEGTVDGFSNASITTASNLLADLEEDLTDAIEDIDGVDDALEMQNQVHYETLATNAAVGLSLITQQKYRVLALLQQIAGLD
jgi:flagellin-like hook-associated protein FlgL